MRLYTRLTILFVLSLSITSCMVESDISTQPTELVGSPTALSEPTLQAPPTIQPTATAIPSPTATNLPATSTPITGPTATAANNLLNELMIDGDCSTLDRPLTYINTSIGHEIKSLITNESCLLQFPADQLFTFGGSMTAGGIYGSIFSDDVVELVLINYDGTTNKLNITVGGFFTRHIITSADGSQIVWSDGDGDPENPDQFISKLWMANADGSDPRVIYQHMTNLAEALILEVMMPIGFMSNGNVLFSIEPAGRGGGWVYSGEHTNLMQTSTNTLEKTEKDLLFTCPERSPFCVGDFTDDFSHFAYTDTEQQALFIVDVISGVDVWQMTESDRSFIGRPQFNVDKDLGFIAVNVVETGSRLQPENGYVGLVDFPYNEVEILTAERASDLITWINDDQLLYYELGRTLDEWRYPIIGRAGTEIGQWESESRFPQIIK
ncbi:MAG: hypothetical protein AAGD96_12495 [Chloroflexota bacterium]